MQQPTRQRQARQGKSTPLPEKRGRKRQTTRSSHANTTHRHVVNHTPPFHNNRKGGARRKTRSREESTTREHMVFGDNVRARWAARALPRTPTQRGRGRGRGRQMTRPHTLTPSPHRHSATHNTTRQHAHHNTTHTRVDSGQRTPPPFFRPHKPSPLFHNDTTLS